MLGVLCLRPLYVMSEVMCNMAHNAPMHFLKVPYFFIEISLSAPKETFSYLYSPDFHQKGRVCKEAGKVFFSRNVPSVSCIRSLWTAARYTSAKLALV